MGSLFGGGSGDQAKAQEQQYFDNRRNIKGATKRIEDSFAGFSPNFYNEQYKNLVASELPQEQQQFQQESDQLGFKLAGQGLGKSSQAKKLGESLSTQDVLAKEGISNQAQGQVNQLKQSVNQNESSLIGEASVANDPGQVAQGALQTASGFQSPLSAQPIGDMFQNWANTYLATRLNTGVNSTNAGANIPNTGAAPIWAGTNSPGSYGSSFMNSASVTA